MVLEILAGPRILAKPQLYQKLNAKHLLHEYRNGIYLVELYTCIASIPLQYNVLYT